MSRRRAPRNQLRAVAYLRVSTDQQDLGMDAQRTQITDWAARGGVEVLAWHEDRVSGGADLEDRPGLADALGALARSDAALFVVAKRDRLARDTTNAGLFVRTVERCGATVASADGVGAGTDPAAKMIVGMLDVIAEFERKQIGGRTKAALAEKRRRGERWNRDAPYGWRCVGKLLEIDDTEQRAVSLARRLRDEGRTLREVGHELARKGYVPRSGGKWRPQTVSNMTRPDPWRQTGEDK